MTWMYSCDLSVSKGNSGDIVISRFVEEEHSTLGVNVGVVKSAGAGRPQLEISEELLEALHTRAGFRWAGIARMLRVSERTLQRQRHEFGFNSAVPSFSDTDNASLVLLTKWSGEFWKRL